MKNNPILILDQRDTMATLERLNNFSNAVPWSVQVYSISFMVNEGRQRVVKLVEGERYWE